MRRTLTTLLVAACVVPGCTSEFPELPITKVQPITGGTLTITPGGLAVAADPDRDAVWLVDLGTRDVGRVALSAGDHPGRVAVDAAGRAHVVLRGAGAVARIDLASGTLVDRRRVCPEPRGVAYDAGHDVVHVACEGGELVTLPAAGGAPVRALRLDRDLRDVVVQGDTLLVSRFRAAEILVVDAEGHVLTRGAPTPRTDADPGVVTSAPVVAWRTIALPGGGAAMVHQMATSTPVGTSLGDYAWGSPCSGPVVESKVTFFGGDGAPTTPIPMPTITAALPVDVAMDAEGHVAVASAGDMTVSFPGSRASLEEASSTDGCGDFGFEEGSSGVVLDATPIAVASWNGRWFAQTREAAQLVEIEGGEVASTIDLGAPRLLNDGAAVFHQAWNGVACASCHPEGREDGHTWTFTTFGARRTQTLTGGLMQRAPFHWRGEHRDLTHLVNDVLLTRMEGDPIGEPGVRALSRWLDGLPAPAASPTGTAEQIAHGKQLFEDPTVGCASCHAGDDLTNHQRVDVGTGTSFQVPSLVGISARAPFFHDGCAATLEERFDPAKASCNGGDLHGHVSQLSGAEVHDLIAYLEML